MKVPDKLQRLIAQLRTHGDIAEIQKRSGFSRFSISQVLAGDGDSQPEVVAAVAEYYEERKDIISDYIIEE